MDEEKYIHVDVTDENGVFFRSEGLVSLIIVSDLFFSVCIIDINRSGLPALMFFALKLALSVESTKGGRILTNMRVI